MNNKPGYHYLSDSAMISTKHLRRTLDIDYRRGLLEHQQPIFDKFKDHDWMGLSREFGNNFICWNPLSARYEWQDPYVKPIPYYPHPTALWEVMFGKPDHDVWNRFARSFHHWLPDFVKLGRRLRSIEPYLAMDWLTNVFIPRVNQYDPVNYIEYCEKHLQYTAVRKFGWESDLAKFGMDPLWWSPSIVDPFKNDPYKIDDVCKQHLAQMFPIKPITKKRII